MYIRRKVFSAWTDENGEEKMYSTSEIINEESYLESLYSEVEQKEFNSKAQKMLRESVELGRDVSRSPYFKSSLKRSGLKGKDLVKHISRRDQTDLQKTGTIHDIINDRASLGFNSRASGHRDNLKTIKKRNPREYDHGWEVPEEEIKNKLIYMKHKR